ncbi:MAG: SAM hydrolase/SAM-dependent halogenase family protein [Acidimicrobiales bacterium]
MTGPLASSGTVFFLSDYGNHDEFAGVVRAVIRRLAPAAVVIDLTHEIPPFDVAAGARALLRAVPHLGEGVVLAVVDPGVGSSRRGVALSVVEEPSRFFVGPDNGLLLPAAQAAGGEIVAVELANPHAGAGSATFDGRDLFAPAAAALCRGAGFAELGQQIDPDTLVRPLLPASRHSMLPDGRRVQWCRVTWVDHFGNLQLSTPPATGDPDVFALVFPEDETSAAMDAVGRMLRRARVFSDLRVGELGVIVDANGSLALVIREGSAAELLGIREGHVVGLAEPPA